MNAKTLALASLLVLAGAVAEAQLLQPVSDERSVSYHAAYGLPCPLDTLYHSTPSAPFALFNESSVSTFELLSGACRQGVQLRVKQNSAVLSDSIRVYEFVESTVHSSPPLSARANSDATIRFSVEDGTRYYFNCYAYGYQAGGAARLSVWLSGPEPLQEAFEEVYVQLDPGAYSYDIDSSQRFGTLSAGIYTFEAHAWAEATTFDIRGSIFAYLTFDAATTVQAMTWDRVKALYRSNEGPSNRVLQPAAPHDGPR